MSNIRTTPPPDFPAAAIILCVLEAGEAQARLAETLAEESRLRWAPRVEDEPERA